MILSRRISLDGVQLDSLDERIIISGFTEDSADETFRSVDRYPFGSRITNQHLNKKKMTVKFQLKVRKGNFADRNEILEKIAKWARFGKVVKSSTRPNRQISVKCTQQPQRVDPRNWTGEYELNFEATGKPYWESTDTVSVTLAQGSSGEGLITITGNMETCGEATIQNKSGGTINTLELTVGAYTMSFTNLGLANNAYLTIDHEEIRDIEVLRVRDGETSKMANKAGDDEFILTPGNNAISFSAGGAVSVTVSARGRYL